MNQLIFKSIETQADLKSAFVVIRELRTKLLFEDFLALNTEAKKRNDYELVTALEGNRCVGIMGFRILYDLAHRKHLYIDDLVVTESHRSKGIGAQLLKYAEKVAKEQQSKGLRLCAAIENVGGKNFYEREGWVARSIAYKKTVEVG